MWRMQSGLAHERLPDRRIVVELTFDDAVPRRGWLLADRRTSSVCARDPLFGVDVYATASSRTWHEIWYGHRSMHRSVGNGDVVRCGQKDLVAQLADWFRLSHFAGEVAARRPPQAAPA